MVSRRYMFLSEIDTLLRHFTYQSYEVNPDSAGRLSGIFDFRVFRNWGAISDHQVFPSHDAIAYIKPGAHQ